MDVKARVSHGSGRAVSIHRSFVIRLYAGPTKLRGAVRGSVEHVVSGETREFRSGKELITVLIRLSRRKERIG